MKGIRLAILHFNQNFSLLSDSERAERERKGDLDQHERVDGDRNQTSMSFAVKKVYLLYMNEAILFFSLRNCTLLTYRMMDAHKFVHTTQYNRTAERDANLIRPMPILQKTMDYLLDLLDKPYNDRFLSMYNFLWDRMRAIRMDLRMQHIFNQEAINMLEQMVNIFKFIPACMSYRFLLHNHHL